MEPYFAKISELWGQYLDTFSSPYSKFNGTKCLLTVIIRAPLCDRTRGRKLILVRL